MIPTVTLGRAKAADGTEMTLLKRGRDFSILADGKPLMTSAMHGSEEALATLGCERAVKLAKPVVVIGGLGMGFSLRAALDILPPRAKVYVAELLPAIVDWNREYLGEFANHPLRDPRVEVLLGDVVTLLRDSKGRFDAALLDVDNGPGAIATAGDGALYNDAGLKAAARALRPSGVYAIWSAWHDETFKRRFSSHGFKVVRHDVRGRLMRGGPHHTIWVGAL